MNKALFSTHKPLLKCVALALGAGFVSVAQAHVSFVANNAYAGARYVATVNIPHGCSGTSDEGEHFDTTRIEIVIPSGFTEVRPMDSTFGPATVIKDESGNVTRLIWTKSTAALTEDDHLYQVTFRGTLPNASLQTLSFDTTQYCPSDTTTAWIGDDAPKIRVLPKRAPGWNKFTAQATLTEDLLKSYFSDALIVWSNGAAYSANPVTAELIETTLTSIATGAEFWVKY